MKVRALIVVSLLLVSGFSRSIAQELGTIDFPTSGSP